MNILFLRSNPVNPDSRVEKEVNSLLGAGHNVLIFAWDREKTYDVEKKEIVLPNGTADIYRVGIKSEFGGGFKKNVIPLAKFQLSIANWMKRNKTKFDSVHACDFDTGFTSYHIAKKLKKKFVYDMFDYYVHSFSVPKCLRKIIEHEDHKIINNADAAIICTEQRKEQIKGTKPKKLTVIHNSPPVIKDDFDKEIKDDKIKIVYVGILDRGRMLKEITEVIAHRNDCEFHVGGFGRYENYFSKMSETNENIHYYGRLSYNETLKLEQMGDIMTAIYDPDIPNHYFAAPNKFYEALMLGKPLIMVNNTGMSHVVKENNLGVCIDFNSNSFDNALSDLIQRCNEWGEISVRMKELYKNNYSWETMEKRLVELYESI